MKITLTYKLNGSDSKIQVLATVLNADEAQGFVDGFIFAMKDQAYDFQATVEGSLDI